MRTDTATPNLIPPTLPPHIAAKLRFADRVLKLESKASILTILAQDVIEAAGQFRRGGFSEKPSAPKRLRLSVFTDGGSRGNPGVAGGGIVFRNDAGEVVYSAGRFFGELTCNQSEYRAAIDAIKVALAAGVGELAMFADSDLIVQQLSGGWKVKNAGMRLLHGEAVALLKKIPRWNATHIPRTKNTAADALANRAMDLQTDFVEVNRLGIEL